MGFILSLFSNWRVVAAGIGVLALLASHGFLYWKGYQSASDNCKAAALQSELNWLKKDLEITRKAQETAVIRAKQRDAENKTLSKKVQDYEYQLEDKPDCVLSDDDANRLQNIQQSRSVSSCPACRSSKPVRRSWRQGWQRCTG